jgi:hypothetical protein
MFQYKEIWDKTKSVAELWAGTKIDSANVKKRKQNFELLMQQTIGKLQNLDAITKERDMLREENKNLKALLSKAQINFGAKVRNLPSSDVMKLFFAEGGSSSKSNSHRLHLINWWNALSKQLPKAKLANIQHITTDDIWEWVYTRYAAESIGPSLARQQVDCMFKVLSWFNPALDKSEIKHNKNKHFPLTEKEWFWLEKDQSETLIKALETFRSNEYWSDVAIIQRGCGFRSEEMALIQTKNCFQLKAGEKWQIRLTPICDADGKDVRTLKTLRSHETVEVPSWAVPALSRRLKKKSFLLDQ